MPERVRTGAVDLELELQVFVSHPMWMLGSKLQSSSRTLRDLDCWALLPAPVFCCCCCCFFNKTIVCFQYRLSLALDYQELFIFKTERYSQSPNHFDFLLFQSANERPKSVRDSTERLCSVYSSSGLEPRFAHNYKFPSSHWFLESLICRSFFFVKNVIHRRQIF